MAKISEKSNKTPGKSSAFMTAMTSQSRDHLTSGAIPKRESVRSIHTSSTTVRVYLHHSLATSLVLQVMQSPPSVCLLFC